MGCGKQSATSPPAAPPAAESAGSREPAEVPHNEQPRATGNSPDSDAGAAAPEPAAVARAVSAGNDSSATLAELTQALRRYSFERQRLPRNLAEVVAAGYVKSLPTAPSGKKFEIDRKTVQVVLVKQ